MKIRTASVASFCLLFVGFTFNLGPVVHAQNQPQQTGPSKYLYISNNIVKPGLASAFYKIEADEVQALRAANAPNHSLGAVPISGSNDVVFFHGFDSYAELQKNHDATVAIAGLMDKLNADNAAEAPLVSDHFTSIYEYQPDLSLHVDRKVEDARFLDITIFHVQPGRHHDFEALVKVFTKAQANSPNVGWAAFEKMYGHDSDDTYIFITLLRSLADVDQEVLDDAKLSDEMGKDQLQLNSQLASQVVKSSENDLFAINPTISYVPDSWLTDSPDFWGKK